MKTIEIKLYKYEELDKQTREKVIENYRYINVEDSSWYYWIQEDFNRFKYVKRLFNRYQSTGTLRERLILNHIITIYNVFGIDPSTRIFFNRLDETQYSLIKTFLVYLNFFPEKNFDGIDIVKIPLDNKIIKILRSL